MIQHLDWFHSGFSPDLGTCTVLVDLTGAFCSNRNSGVWLWSCSRSWELGLSNGLVTVLPFWPGGSVSESCIGKRVDFCWPCGIWTMGSCCLTLIWDHLRIGREVLTTHTHMDYYVIICVEKSIKMFGPSEGCASAEPWSAHANRLDSADKLKWNLDY